MAVNQPGNGRITLPRGVSISSIITLLGIIIGLVVQWTHFENRATNNAKDIASLQTQVMLLRNELRSLERSYDRQVSQLNAALALLEKNYEPLPSFQPDKDKP